MKPPDSHAALQGQFPFLFIYAVFLLPGYGIPMVVEGRLVCDNQVRGVAVNAVTIPVTSISGFPIFKVSTL